MPYSPISPSYNYPPVIPTQVRQILEEQRRWFLGYNAGEGIISTELITAVRSMSEASLKVSIF